MINCRGYVAVDETTGMLYDHKQLMGAVHAIATPIDFDKYEIPPPAEPGIDFFEFGNLSRLLDIIVTQEATGTVIIGSNNRHPRVIKARLETHAKNLILEGLD